MMVNISLGCETWFVSWLCDIRYKTKTLFTIFGTIVQETKIHRIMKHYLLSVLFMLSLVSLSFGQLQIDYEIKQAIEFYRTNKFIDGSGKNQLSEKDIKGSPYLNDEFETGTIFTIQRLKYEDIPLRYNIYNDELEFKTPDGEVQAMAAPDIVEKAVFGATQLVYITYPVSNKIKKGFFIVILEGKASLYAKPGVTFKEPTEPAAYKEAEPAIFLKKTDEYFIRIGNEQAVLINNKKDLIAVFPDNQDKIESFINKNKIKTNKPESLKEVVRFYNSL